MVEITSVEALNNHLPWVSEVLQDADRFLINSMSIIILSKSTVVHVGELAGNLAVIEQIIDQH
jgi:hypothetical protein